MSTKTERVVAHDEQSKFLKYRPEKRGGIFFLKNIFDRPKTYKTVVAPRVFKNTQNKRDS